MSYKLYYNPRLELLGLLVKANYIRIYMHEGMKIFMIKTNEWQEIGEL